MVSFSDPFKTRLIFCQNEKARFGFGLFVVVGRENTLNVPFVETVSLPTSQESVVVTRPGE